MNRLMRIDERMAAMAKPALQPVTAFELTKDDCLVLCAGFEDRASAVLKSAVAHAAGCRVITIIYEPFIPANRLDEIRGIVAGAAMGTRQIVYDRMNPAGFGDALLREVADVRGRLFLDISAMSRLLIVQNLVALRDWRRGFEDCVVAYAEATDYPPTQTEVGDALRQAEANPLTSLLLLSSGVDELTLVPELSAASVGSIQTRLVAFPSFNPEQITALRNELSPSRCTFIHGVPPREENKWRTEAIAKINQIPLSASDNIYASTLDYRETLDCLLRLYGEHSERERMLVSPTGSKMQAVAVGLFRAVLDDVQIVYPTPREFRAHHDYTRGVRQLYMLPLAALACVEGQTHSSPSGEDTVPNR